MSDKSESETPETDVLWEACIRRGPTLLACEKLLDHARAMEQQRDEARRELAAARAQSDGRLRLYENTVLERNRYQADAATAWERHAEKDRAYQQALDERDTARAELDNEFRSYAKLLATERRAVRYLAGQLTCRSLASQDWWVERAMREAAPETAGAAAATGPGGAG